MNKNNLEDSQNMNIFHDENSDDIEADLGMAGENFMHDLPVDDMEDDNEDQYEDHDDFENVDEEVDDYGNPIIKGRNPYQSKMSGGMKGSIQIQGQEHIYNDKEPLIQNKKKETVKMKKPKLALDKHEDFGDNQIDAFNPRDSSYVVNDIKTSQKLIDIYGDDQDDAYDAYGRANKQNVISEGADVISGQNIIDVRDSVQNDDERIPPPVVTSSPKEKKGGKIKEKEFIGLSICDEAQQSKQVIAQQISQAELNLKPHERKIGQYILGKTIGEGTFGKVKIGMHILTKAKVAVKILEKSKIVDVADVERVSREIHILKIVQHPQVVQLYEIIETQKKLYLIMEYASGGELFDYIVKHQRVKEPEACKFFQQLLSGIEYISRLNIVHRDLKPENLLLDFDKGIKIVDFGLSNTYKTGELLKTACGSPCYAAPEMIAGKKYNGTNVDIWSCGVILFALICGYLPFEDPNTSNLYKKILSADFQTPEWVSDDAKDLFHCILNTDPEKRYTIDQIRQHPWFKMVPCESNFKGIKVGVDPVPIDGAILDTMQNQYGIDKQYARKCIQANKHNHISASYYLLLKELIKKGEKSIADVRQPDYNPQLFVHTALQVRREKMRDKLENASMQSQKFQEEQEEPQPDIMPPSDSNANLAIVEKEKDKIASEKDNQRASAKAAPKVPERNKSTQPQRLRKIADGLLEFERYADRKKRLQNLNEKQQTQEIINTMNQKLSQSKMQEDMLSNGGLGLLQRGLSPIGCNVTTDQGFDVNDQNMLFNQNFMEGRDYSPSLSPVNMQKGNMSTQFGNFLYQKDAKQFNPNMQPQTQQKSSIEQYQLTALKNQLLMQQQNNQLGQVNVNQMNTKQIHKQLKQLYMQSKKGGNQKSNNIKNANSKIVADNEIILKNLVNQSQMAGANTNSSQQNTIQTISHMSNISRMQALQKNYQKKTAKPAQNFSTIQTAYDTLQHQNQQNMMLNKPKKGSVHHNKNMSHNLGNDVASPTNAPSSHHNRFATTTYTTNPVFSTIQQPNNNYNIQNTTMNNSATPGYNVSQKTDKFASTHGAFFAQNGSRLGVQSNLQGKGKRNKNSTVSGSGSFIQPSGVKNKGGVFSPKNPPTNSFGFGVAPQGGQFNQTQPHTLVLTTPQNMPNNQQMFTIDQQPTTGNFSNQLKASLHQQNQQNRTMMESLTLQQKQNSQPVVKPQNSGNTGQNPSQSSQSRPRIGANKRGSSIQQRNNLPSMQKQDITSQQSQQSNKALFKRRRDHSKTNKQNKSAQKYSQYGTIQQHDSKNNLTSKPPLNESVVNRSMMNSQKKINNKTNKSVGKNQSNNAGTYRNDTHQSNNPNASMKRIIETSQNLANLNINIGNPMTAISTKNSNLFSPVVGGQIQSPQMPLTPNYQHADQLTSNVNRIQNQLNIKKQQRQNQKSGSMATAKNTRNLRDSLEQKTASQATTAIQNMSSLASPNASRHDNGGQAHQLSTFTAVPVHSFQQQMQQYNQFSPQNINTKKIQMNTSLMTQNYAPHLLLQNFHGNGYPPGQQISHAPVPSSQNNTINQFMSPQNNHPANQLQVQVKQAQRRKTPQLNQTQMKQAPITTTKAWGNNNKFANAMPPLDNSNIDFSDDVDISNNTIANIQQQLGGGNNSMIIQSPSPTKKGKGSKSQNQK